jgi:hypothetical protein
MPQIGLLADLSKRVPDETARIDLAALLDRASSGELIVRRRMIEDMTIRKIAPKTQHDYVEAGTHHT